MILHFDYTKAYRQGECLFFRLKEGSLRHWSGVKGRRIDSGVIRVGEKQGHEHKLVGGKVQLTMFDDSPAAAPGDTNEQPSEGIVEVGEGGAQVVHPEHKPLKLPKGKYAIQTQKEATGRHSHASVKD